MPCKCALCFNVTRTKAAKTHHASPSLLCVQIRAAEVAKMVSQSWKNLSDEQRAPWLEMGRKDRERYDAEKAAYTGPWKVPAVSSTTLAAAAVAGDAPKKPMSAFLAFSNQRRKAIVTPKPVNGPCTSVIVPLGNNKSNKKCSPWWRPIRKQTQQALVTPLRHPRPTIR